jgi:uncharacterized protein (DUF1684 family)
MTVQQHETDLAGGTFAREWAGWHRAHETRRADPHGFLAVTALHWLTGEPHRFEGIPGTWSTGERGVVVVLDPGEELFFDGSPLTGEHVVGVLPERGGVNCTFGETVLEIARRGGSDILRPRHPANPLLLRYPGTAAFPPHPRWVTTGRYVPFSSPRPTTVGAAVAGLEHVYEAPGRVEFELLGELLSLTVFDGAAPGSLFALFTDATSGISTYAANRSLQIEAPDADGAVVLDFNRATNLPCAYTDLATCPLPPTENRLPVAIEAGERTPVERLEAEARV